MTKVFSDGVTATQLVAPEEEDFPRLDVHEPTLYIKSVEDSLNKGQFRWVKPNSKGLSFGRSGSARLLLPLRRSFESDEIPGRFRPLINSLSKFVKSSGLNYHDWWPVHAWDSESRYGALL